jgi:hypothetical protein
MVSQRIRHIADAFRPPNPIETIDAAESRTGTVIIGIGIGDDVTAAMHRLQETVSEPSPVDTLLVPIAGAGPRFLTSLIEWRSALGAVTVGVPVSTARRERAQVRHLAATTHAQYVELGGNRHWFRITLSNQSSILPFIDIPADLRTSSHVILASKLTRRSALAIWRHLVHPNSALRAAPAGMRAIAEFSLATQATYVFTIRRSDGWVAVYSNDRIASELLAVGLARLDEDRSGIEAEGPWEEPHIQHLTELAAGIRLASELIIHANVHNNDARQHVNALAELLGGSVRWG